MIFYYIRHGDPIYSPDSLTPLGMRQAEAVAKRLSVYGLDKIYASTSNRARLTAQPTCEVLKKEMELLDFANEGYASNDFTIERDGNKRWIFQDDDCMDLFTRDATVRYSEKWYEHPQIKQYDFGKGVERIYRESDGFFKTLGYEHIRGTGRYNITEPKYQRVALFAHQGFGMAFMSTILDIPLPLMYTHFDICHSSVTVINFEKRNGGFAIPRVLTLSNDSHIYKEGYATNYNNEIRI